ncbi:MAG: FHA domain-containing protein [Anaerolineae bacterium]
MTNQEALAKIRWVDPSTNTQREYLLSEGATATIGRSSQNDIHIAEQHVSRQHAVISYRDGIFMINDLASSNGTFVNDQPVEAPFPLFAGDVIRLFQPELQFLAVSDDEVIDQNSTFIEATNPDGQASLIITNGPQEGQTVAILLDQVEIGRATSNATWQVLLQDPSVSRPHARLHKQGAIWHLTDLKSSNGTRLNHNLLEPNDPAPLRDGDKIELGGSILLFRTGWERPDTGNASGSDVMTRPMN